MNFDEQLEFFKLIGKELKEKVECYTIGGSAMMFYGAKVDTRDVDLVFLNKRELEQVKNVLFRIGFEEKKILVKIFKHYEIAKNEPVMMIRKDTRFDLFLNEIISFKMTDSIIERIKESHEFNNLVVKIVSPEDIILMKCATEREKDRIDALGLLKKFDIKWDIIIEEAIHQTKIGKLLYPVFLFDFLYELKEDLKADIPKKVLDKILDISEKIMVKKLKKDKRNKL